MIQEKRYLICQLTYKPTIHCPVQLQVVIFGVINVEYNSVKSCIISKHCCCNDDVRHHHTVCEVGLFKLFTCESSLLILTADPCVEAQVVERTEVQGHLGLFGYDP